MYIIAKSGQKNEYKLCWWSPICKFAQISQIITAFSTKVSQFWYTHTHTCVRIYIYIMYSSVKGWHRTVKLQYKSDRLFTCARINLHAWVCGCTSVRNDKNGYRNQFLLYKEERRQDCTLGEGMNPLSTHQLQVEQYHFCSFAMIDLALNNPRRMEYHDTNKPKPKTKLMTVNTDLVYLQ